jgi:hypothetical protein
LNCSYLFYFKFAFLNGFFDGFLNQFIVPGIVERGFVPDYRFNLEFHLVMTDFTNIPVGHVEVIASHNGGLDDILANVTGKGLHKKYSFKVKINDCYYTNSRKLTINKENHKLK